MLIFLTAFVLCLALIPVVRRLAARTGRISTPRQDRWSSRPTPYLGGIAIFAGFAVALLASIPLNQLPLNLIAGATLAFLVGLIDDFRTLNPAVKMVGILLAASLMVFGGYTTAFFASPLANIIITLLWIAGITNAFNLLDNMDGLAAGTTLVVSIFLGFFFYRSGNMFLLTITLALAGSTLGFWIFNFPPALIYMGDSGSLFLGTLLATVSIAREPQASNVFAIVAVPTMIFLLPILDTVLVSLTRIFRGQSPVQGGRDHASHRLVMLGLSERQTLFILLSIALVSGVTAILAEQLSYALSLFIIPVLVVIFTLVSAYLGQVKISTATPDDKSKSDGNSSGFALRRRLLEILLDFFLILFASFWADSVTGSSLTDNLVLILPIILGVSYLFLFLLGIYRFLWRYFGLPEIIRVLFAAGFASLGSLAAYTLIFPKGPFEPVYFFVFGAFLFGLVASTRVSFRVLGMLFRRARQSESAPVLIFGAGDAGDLVLRECLGNESLGFRVVGFIDDDPGKLGHIVHGVPVMGGIHQLDALIKAHAVRGIIIATGSALAPDKMGKIIDVAKANGAWVRRFSLQLELL